MKKALCVLIQHNLVTYQLQKRGFVEYQAHCQRVLRILRYPRYIYTAKSLYGDTGELIVEELLLNGKMTMSALVKKVADRLTETMEGGNFLSWKTKTQTKRGCGSRRGGGSCWSPVLLGQGGTRGSLGWVMSGRTWRRRRSHPQRG